MSVAFPPNERPRADHNCADILRQFEHLWRTERRPDVREFWLEHASFGRELLSQLVVLDYDLAWEAFRQGAPGIVTPEPPPAAVYQRRFPELQDDDNSLLELLFLEIVNWENPDEGHYLRNFARLEAELRSIFSLIRDLRPEQFHTWSGSVSRMMRAHAGSSFSLRLEPSDDSRDGNGAADDAADGTLEPIPDGTTFTLADTFQIVGDVIGSGAFKRVYQGRQTSTGRTVAVKQLVRPTRRGIRNFVSEGRAQAALDHQNIPPVILMGDQNGRPTFLLEKLIRAPDWSSLIRDRARLARNMEILLTVARAAAYAHRECRLVHRDIKPQNILVGKYHEVYLVDWGLAVQVGADAASDGAIRHLKDEPDGYIVGPPAYMAPEMALGHNRRSSPATDVFMLGAILYEILTGRPPYDAYPRTACLRAAARIIPELPSSIPQELREIVARALAREPLERYVDAGDFADALERHLAHQEAENQLARAETNFRELLDEIGRAASLQRAAPTLVAALIGVADQCKQAARLWRPSDAGSAVTADDTYAQAGFARAQETERRVRESLVDLALQCGDLALAESQARILDELHSPQAASFLASVARAWERRKRERRQRVAMWCVSLSLFVAAATFWQLRTHALARADRAEANENSERAQRLVAESNQRAADANAEAERARAQAAEEERLRKSAELFAEQQRVERERDRARFADAKRLQDRAAAAESASFHQVGVHYQLAAARTLGADVPDSQSYVRLLETRQLALVPTRTSSRRVPTAVVALSPDGSTLVTTDMLGKAIRVWSTATWRQQFVLRGHRVPLERGGLWGTIRGVAFDPLNADTIYTAGLDGTVRAWSLARRLELRRYDPSMLATGDELLSLAVRNSGASGQTTEIVVGKRDGKLLVFDATTLERPRELPAHSGRVTAVRLAPDGRRLASASSDGHVKIWDDDFRELAAFSHPDQTRSDQPVPLFDVAWSADGQKLAFSGESARIPVWDVRQGAIQDTLTVDAIAASPTARVRALAWSEAGILSAGGSDGLIHRWNTRNAERLEPLTGHTSNRYQRADVLALAQVTQLGDLIVSSGRDDAIRVWDSSRGRTLFLLEGADIGDEDRLLSPPIHVAYARGTDQLIIAADSFDAPARLWDVDHLREARRFPQFPELGDDDADRRVQGLAITEDATRFVSSDLSGNLLFWSCDEPAPRSVVRGHSVTTISGGPPPSHIIPLAIDRSGEHVASHAPDGVFRLWSIEGESVNEWSADDPTHTAPSPGLSISSVQQPGREPVRFDTNLAFLSDQILVSAGRDEIVRFWDVKQGRIAKRVELPAQVSCLEMDFTRRLLAAGTVDGQIFVYDLSVDDRPRLVFADAVIPLLDASHFGRPAQFSSQQSSTGKEIQRRWSARIRSLSFAPRRDTLAVTQGDGSLTLIKMDSREVFGRAMGHSSPKGFMQSVVAVFTKNGQLLTIGDDQLVREWNFNSWRTGRQELPGSRDLGGGWAVAATFDGQEWILASGDGLMRWHVDDPATRFHGAIPGEFVRGAVAIPRSDDLLIGTRLGRVMRYSRTANRPVATLAEVASEIESNTTDFIIKLAVDSRGTLAASSRPDGKTDLWKLADGSRLGTIDSRGQSSSRWVVESLAFHPDGTQLAITDFEGHLRIWKLDRTEVPQLQHELLGPQQATGLCYSPDGSRLVQAGMDQNSQTVVVWDVNKGRQVTSLTGHRSMAIASGGRTPHALDAEFSSDGRWLATSGSDESIRLWRVTIADDPTRDIYEPAAVLSTRELRPIGNSSADTTSPPNIGNVGAWVTSLAFRSDSRQLAALVNAGPVFVFDLTLVEQELGNTVEQMSARIEAETSVRLKDETPTLLDSLHLVPVRTGD